MPPQSQDNELTKDDKKIPEWLKAEVFEDLLKQQVVGYKSTKELRVRPGVAVGDNYATIMLRIELDIETNDKRKLTQAYMLKTPHKSDLYREMMKETNIFDIERGMYLNIVPELEQMYRNVGIQVKFGASSYEIAANDDYVLLEDLRPKGFRNADRLQGLNVAHTQCVLRKLAQWHAASAVRVDSIGPYETVYTKGFFNLDNTKILEDLNTNNINILLKYIDQYEGHESFLSDLQNMLSKPVDFIRAMSEPNPNEFNALNHGDFWSNNIMFQYNEQGEIQETFFVDFQIPKYGTVAQDLIYLLLSSTSLDIKISEFEYFIRFYHTALTKHLQLLNYKRKLPTLSGIHQALYKYGAWGFFTVLNVMGVVLLEPTEGADFDSFFETDSSKGESSFKRSIYTNKRYRKHMEVLIPWLQNRGALE